jgi:hypothetical protein
VASRQPFSRSRSRRDELGDGADDAGGTLVAAFEFAAAEYGWLPGTILDDLSDEQLVAYFDEAGERKARDADTAFESRLEAVRLGTVFAHDVKQYQQWRSTRAVARPRQSVAASDEALERQIYALASLFPGNVIREAMPT